MRKLCCYFLLAFVTIPPFLMAQNVGIGTTNPVARLHVMDSAVVFSAAGPAPFASAKTAIEGAGRRMMWHPGKAAFRVGYVYGGGWDDNSIGHFSFAAGQEVIARGNSSIALGQFNYAEGIGAIAIGANCNAKYNYSVAIGRDAISLAGNGIAIGTGASATNLFGLALGYVATSSGEKAFSIGNFGTASGTQSFAIGNNTTASGINSFAIGNYVSTSNLSGAFALGDNSTTTVMQSFAENGFRARFAGGYRLFTNSAVTIGAFLNSGANSWAALSDVRMKENFLPVDGEKFLQKIAAMPLTTWNYIGQDVGTLRHYGPMAQDFYKAFGRDDLGEIGCDTLINQQDFLGVSFIAIQALEKRSTELATENSLLKNKLLLLETANKNLAEKLSMLSEHLNTSLRLLKEQLTNKNFVSNKPADEVP